MGNAKSYASDATFDVDDATEVRLRSPMNFVSAIRTPTFIFEGAKAPSNAGALPYLKPEDSAVPVRTYAVVGVSHFSILSPVTTLLARKLAGGTGDVDLTEAELRAAVAVAGTK